MRVGLVNADNIQRIVAMGSEQEEKLTEEAERLYQLRVQKLNSGEYSLDTVMNELFEPVADEQEVVDKNQTNILDEIESKEQNNNTDLKETETETSEN